MEEDNLAPGTASFVATEVITLVEVVDVEVDGDGWVSSSRQMGLSRKVAVVGLPSSSSASFLCSRMAGGVALFAVVVESPVGR